MDRSVFEETLKLYFAAFAEKDLGSASSGTRILAESYVHARDVTKPFP